MNDHRNPETPDSTDSRPYSTAPTTKRSGWLIFYALTFLIGGVCMLYSATTPIGDYRKVAVFAGVYCLFVAALLWMRSRWALHAYISVGIAAILWSIFRLSSAGFEIDRVGIIFGGILILSGYKSVAEELE